MQANSRENVIIHRPDIVVVDVLEQCLCLLMLYTRYSEVIQWTSLCGAYLTC